MHPALEVIRNAVQGTEFENDLYLVGGAVRDELLGRPSDDLDLVTTGNAIELAKRLYNLGVAEHFPVTFERFGTAMIHIQGYQIELITARKESYSKNSRKPNVKPGTILDDALRRDFTCNTLLRRLSDEQLIDPLGNGLDDLNRKILRTPKEPDQTFIDDPLRMLRAVRFRWKLGFEYADGLPESIQKNSDRLRIISAERIRDEFLKILQSPTAADAIDELSSLGLFRFIAPELEAGKGMEQGDFHSMDVWYHSLQVLRNAGHHDPILSLAALLHDVGKPETKAIVDGRIRFFGHEVVGASMTRRILGRLKFSNDEIAEVAVLVKNHMRLGTATKFSSSAARKLMRDLGPNLNRLLDLVEADASALARGVRKLDLTDIRAVIDRIQNETPVETLESPLDGAEIIEILNLTPGPEVGKIKQRLIDAVLEGQIAPKDKEGAKRLLLQDQS